MINNHEDYTKPFWVAKYEDNSVIKYGEISEGQVLSTSMPIKTFEKKQSMINFIEENNGTFIEFEL